MVLQRYYRHYKYLQILVSLYWSRLTQVALYLQRIGSRSTRDDHSGACWHDIKSVMMKMRTKHITCVGCRYLFLTWQSVGLIYFNPLYSALPISRGHFSRNSSRKTPRARMWVSFTFEVVVVLWIITSYCYVSGVYGMTNSADELHKCMPHDDFMI